MLNNTRVLPAYNAGLVYEHTVRQHTFVITVGNTGFENIFRTDQYWIADAVGLNKTPDTLSVIQRYSYHLQAA